MKEIYYIVKFFNKRGGDYQVYVPSIPNCSIKESHSVEEVIINSRKAIAGYLKDLVKKGLPIPKEKSRIKIFSIPVEVKLPSLV